MEKKKEIWLSPMTETLYQQNTPIHNTKGHQNIDYTTIADRLRTEWKLLILNADFKNACEIYSKFQFNVYFIIISFLTFPTNW